MNGATPPPAALLLRTSCLPLPGVRSHVSICIQAAALLLPLCRMLRVARQAAGRV